MIGVVARQVGIHMTPHQFRHFAAVAYLEDNPQDFETPRALLGHSFGKTTRIYAGSSARRAYGQSVSVRDQRQAKASSALQETEAPNK